MTEQEVRAGCEALSQQLKDVSSSDVRRAEEVGRYPQNFYHMSKEPKASTLEPDLDTEERKQLIAERERLFSQKGLVTIICTISLAAFLQGHVQSSINAGSLFARTDIKGTELNEWQLGGMNASPFLGAALLGAPLSLPVNYCVGRRGALGLSAILIVASSIGAAFSRTWIQVLGARIIGGLGKSPFHPLYEFWYMIKCRIVIADKGARDGYQSCERANPCLRNCCRVLERIYASRMAVMVSHVQVWYQV